MSGTKVGPQLLIGVFGSDGASGVSPDSLFGDFSAEDL
jgi:hypothetical protein